MLYERLHSLRSAAAVAALGLAALVCAPRADAADKDLALGFAKSATVLLEQGKTPMARELFLKALAYDDTNAEALYGLAQIMEKEGTAGAADFYVRAAQQFGAQEAANPALATKRKDAERRAQTMNRFAAQYTAALADYATSLTAATKKAPDSITLEEACDRADLLLLRSVLPPDKAPKFTRPVAVKPPERRPGMPEDFPSRAKPVVNDVPPEVERVLKDPVKGGWTRITGTWRKKAENVYEVTDGKLEADKTNGGLNVIVHGPTTATVRMMVRSKEDEESYYYDGRGYGYVIEKGADLKLYSPTSSFTGGNYSAWLERTDAVPPGPKSSYTIMIEGIKLEYFVNNASKKKANYQISNAGVMVIEIKGTATIEMPKAMGR